MDPEITRFKSLYGILHYNDFHSNLFDPKFCSFMRMYLITENNTPYVTITDRDIGYTTFLVLLLHFFNKIFYHTAIFIEKNT